MTTRPEITVLCCKYCGHVPVELAGKRGEQYPAETKVLDVGCTGSIAVIDLLRALEEGANGVLVVACAEGNCHHLVGNERASQRVALARRILDSAGLAPQRLQLVNLGVGNARAFAETVRDMTESIRRIEGMGEGNQEGEAIDEDRQLGVP